MSMVTLKAHEMSKVSQTHLCIPVDLELPGAETKTLLAAKLKLPQLTSL